MSDQYIHCRGDGTAFVSVEADAQDGDVAVLSYEDGMKVVFRAELSSGIKRCTTVTVGDMHEGKCKSIVNLEKAGQGAKIVGCERKVAVKKKASTNGSMPADEGEIPLEEIPDEDGGTPAALWVSGMKNVPSALPSGKIAFLIMQAEWYEMIESGEKDVEYRKQCKKYKSMFVDHKPVAVKLQYGFTPRQMIWQVIDVEDCGANGIEIYLGKRIR